MTLTLRKISPEQFNPDIHTLPTAGELLLAGATVAIDADGVAFAVDSDASPDGMVIEVSKKGQVVEVAALGEQQEDGGYYFSDICVMQAVD